jgi:hypothetical protein
VRNGYKSPHKISEPVEIAREILRGSLGAIRHLFSYLEVTLAPQEDRTRIASLIVKTKSGNRILPFSAISSIAATTNPSTIAPQSASPMP